jgi:hypothetical protein
MVSEVSETFFWHENDEIRKTKAKIKTKSLGFPSLSKYAWTISIFQNHCTLIYSLSQHAYVKNTKLCMGIESYIPTGPSNTKMYNFNPMDCLSSLASVRFPFYFRFIIFFFSLFLNFPTFILVFSPFFRVRLDRYFWAGGRGNTLDDTFACWFPYIFNGRPEMTYYYLVRQTVVFWIDIFCQLETRFLVFDAVYTCVAVPALHIGRTHQVQKAMTTSLWWSKKVSSLWEYVPYFYGSILPRSI